jgi:hypothetical protein
MASGSIRSREHRNSVWIEAARVGGLVIGESRTFFEWKGQRFASSGQHLVNGVQEAIPSVTVRNREALKHHERITDVERASDCLRLPIATGGYWSLSTPTGPF